MPKRTQERTRKQLELAARRKAVAQNIQAGVTHEQMAEMFAVSVGTINNDKKAVMKAWREAFIEDYNDFVITQMARYERLLNAVWDDARSGSLARIDRALNIMSQMNTLVGANKVHLDITSDGKPLEILHETKIYNLTPEQIQAAQRAYHAALPYGETVDGNGNEAN